MIRKTIIVLSMLLCFACASQQTTTEPVTSPGNISPPAEKIPEPSPGYNEPVPLSEEQKCALKKEAALDKVRRVVTSNDMYIGNLLPPGAATNKYITLNKERFYVLDEKVNDCGWIIYYLDSDDDGVSDKEAFWKPVINEYTLEVFFRYHGLIDAWGGFFAL